MYNLRCFFIIYPRSNIGMGITDKNYTYTRDPNIGMGIADKNYTYTRDLNISMGITDENYIYTHDNICTSSNAPLK